MHLSLAPRQIPTFFKNCEIRLNIGRKSKSVRLDGPSAVKKGVDEKVVKCVFLRCGFVSKRLSAVLCGFLVRFFKNDSSGLKMTPLASKTASGL